MSRRPPTQKKPARRLESALDGQQKEIAAQEEKLRAQMEKYQRLIEDAPKLAAERARRQEEKARVQREQFITRASKTDQARPSRAIAPGRRPPAVLRANAAPVRERRFRAERNEGRGQFFLLLFLYLGVVTWLYFHFHG